MSGGVSPGRAVSVAVPPVTRAWASSTSPWMLVTADGEIKGLLSAARVVSAAGGPPGADRGPGAPLAGRAGSVPDVRGPGIDDRAAAPPTAPMNTRREGLVSGCSP